ncbi:MAG: hypothetical protein WBR09_10430 [Serratia proteamaculans]
MKKPTCMFCDEPATLLCDGLIGWDADEDHNGLMQNCRGMFTCDAPMCRTCGTWHNNLFFDGKVRFVDTHDLCPLCQALHDAGKRIRIAEHRKDSALPEPCLTAGQAAIIRAAHWAKGLKIENGGGQRSFDF